MFERKYPVDYVHRVDKHLLDGKMCKVNYLDYLKIDDMIQLNCLVSMKNEMLNLNKKSFYLLEILNESLYQLKMFEDIFEDFCISQFQVAEEISGKRNIFIE